MLMNDKVYHRLGSEKDRPRSPTLNEAQKHLKPTLEEYFQHFWTVSCLDILPLFREYISNIGSCQKKVLLHFVVSKKYLRIL